MTDVVVPNPTNRMTLVMKDTVVLNHKIMVALTQRDTLIGRLPNQMWKEWRISNLSAADAVRKMMEMKQ